MRKFKKGDKVRGKIYSYNKAFYYEFEGIVIYDHEDDSYGVKITQDIDGYGEDETLVELYGKDTMELLEITQSPLYKAMRE